ncbi:hypothetical protein MKZ38_001845 [Zalerion maritima]|uniref:alpha-amylase n=1 Tax=Zalerion maritima TaxID=339359 RepID=A0AAD5RQS5_9PEZI|nr:hypothetical protein MKZ38_001845 [Zalerion maritima]
MKPTAFLSLLAAAVAPVLALDANGWSKQSVYQVMTDRFARSDGSVTAGCDPDEALYCGGSFQGIIQRLDYIQGMGFTAIWISPIVTQVEGTSDEGEAFHGFWAQDIWSINNHFGTEDDLKELADELHSRDMYLMVDVVANHMAYIGCLNCVDYSIYNPFNDASYYHDPCFIDYSDEYSTILQTCWEGDDIVSLPDLRTEDDDVRAIWMPWISEIVSEYGIDGLRIDSAKHVEKSFHPLFEDAAGVYTVGEVLNGDPAYTLDYLNYMSGVLNYPLYFWAKRAFGTEPGDFSELSDGIVTLTESGHNVSYLGNFISNHDMSTWQSFTTDTTLNKNALAFIMMIDGYPIIFEGHEQGFNGDVEVARSAVWLTGYDTTTELYSWIAQMNEIRRQAISSDSEFIKSQTEPIYTVGMTMATKKGSTLSVYSSGGDIATDYDVSISSTGYDGGQQLVEVIGCTISTVADDGSLSVTVAKGMPQIFRPIEQITGSGICPDSTAEGGDSSTSTETSSAPSCTASSVYVTFEEEVETVFGDTIKIVGNAEELGSWDTNNAVALEASDYTAEEPIWAGTVILNVGVIVEYKYILVDSSGSVTWEADPNHTLTVDACESMTTITDVWHANPAPSPHRSPSFPTAATSHHHRHPRERERRTIVPGRVPSAATLTTGDRSTYRSKESAAYIALSTAMGLGVVSHTIGGAMAQSGIDAHQGVGLLPPLDFLE